MEKYGYEFTEEQLTKTAQVVDRLDILIHMKAGKNQKKKDVQQGEAGTKNLALDFTDPACAG